MRWGTASVPSLWSRLLTSFLFFVANGQKGRDVEVLTYSVGGVNEGVVDSDDIDLAVLNGIAEDDTANAAETVDTSLDNHFDFWDWLAKKA